MQSATPKSSNHRLRSGNRVLLEQRKRSNIYETFQLGWRTQRQGVSVTAYVCLQQWITKYVIDILKELARCDIVIAAY